MRFRLGSGAGMTTHAHSASRMLQPWLLVASAYMLMLAAADVASVEAPATTAFDVRGHSHSNDDVRGDSHSANLRGSTGVR